MMSETGGGDASRNEREELERYRQKVLHQLKEREQRMQEVEKGLLQVAFRLKECGVQRLARQGNVEKLMRGEKQRKDLNSERDRLSRLLDEARADVHLARERLEMAEEDLRKLRGGEV